jgi:hypothetical protein
MYRRVRFRPANAKPRTVWAANYKERNDLITFTICDREGVTNEAGTINVVACLPADIVYSKPAALNKHYGELEVI